MRRLILTALVCGALACIPVHTSPREYFVMQTPRTFSDSAADSVTVHLDDRLQVWLNSYLLLGRKEQLEQAACLRIARIDKQGVWLDSLIDAAIVPGMTTLYQIVFKCPDNTVPIHWHSVTNFGSYQCIPSDADKAKGWSKFPALMLVCGVGPDSAVAWKARAR